MNISWSKTQEALGPARSTEEVLDEILWHREDKQLTQGGTASKQKSRDLNPGVFLLVLWDADRGADIQHLCHDIKAAAVHNCLPRRYRRGVKLLLPALSARVSVDVC
ncbi:PREDICTED: uncharacterized protein LOC105575666 [Cercocebus atys]|uniref:uncharacterized protein LOC105575666 n=1 Tax=Cercocebus atys TaxID=9531 RepID=UPI0005F3F8FA|nr:PREDICTED: uncharacterized protein LOC105575666 [Cercocebus atys]